MKKSKPGSPLPKVKLRPGGGILPGEVKLPFPEEIPAAKVKLKPWTKVKPGTRAEVKLPPDPAAEDWKILKTFVGVKFNDREKQRLWPAVAPDHVDLFGHRKAQRPNLGTFIKQAIWEKVERDGPRKHPEPPTLGEIYTAAESLTPDVLGGSRGSRDKGGKKDRP
jgi:hypothetical protein